MTINNKEVGSPDAGSEIATNTGAVLPKLVNHNTPEQAFQEGINDVVLQVDQNQADIGYSSIIGGLTPRTGRESRSVDERLDTVEDALGVSNDALGMLPTTSLGTLPIGGADTTMDNTGPDISGTLATPRINDRSIVGRQIANDTITQTQIAADAVSTTEITDDAGILRTQLETDLQTYDVIVGKNAEVSRNLGQDVTVPVFRIPTGTITTQDGVVNAPLAAEVTTAASTDGTGTIWVLGSDNNWHELNEYARVGGGLVPASSVDSSFTTHRTTAAVPAGTDIPAFLAVGANRLEGSPAVQYGLQNGDLVVVTDTTPTPDQTIAFVYVGPTVAAGAAAQATDIIALGVASTYGVQANGGLVVANNNFAIAGTIPGARTFSGALTANGGLTATTASVTNATTLNGTLNANGDVNLGNTPIDTVTVTGDVDSNITPRGNGTQALGSTTRRWDVFADALNVGTGVTVPARSIDEAALNPAGSETGQIPTSAGPNADVAWMDPPIGVEMVTSLPASPSSGSTGDYPNGVLVSLTQVDGTMPAGIYRNNAGTWQRLGTITTILSKSRVTTVTGNTSYTTTNSLVLAEAHFVTIDGLVLVEGAGQDYTVNSNRQGITLSSAVSGGRDLEFFSFGDIAALGTSSVALTALAGGTLPDGVRINGSAVTGAVSAATNATNATNATSATNATNATAATNNTFTIGNWAIAQDANGRLTFANSGTVRARLDTDGHFRTENDITAFDTLPD